MTLPAILAAAFALLAAVAMLYALRLLWLEGECGRLREAKDYYIELINDLMPENE